MSWASPSQNEATEQYYSYRNKYNNAAAAKRSSEQEEASYVSQRSNAKNQLATAKSDKVNFEKRLAGIEKIIKMLEGSGGLFTSNVPGTITKANKALDQANTGYRNSIRVTGSGRTSSLQTAFETQSVTAETHSASALSDLKSEKTRLTQAIEDLNQQIKNLGSLISDLSGRIRSCNYTQASLQRTMNSCSYEMFHYSYYMNQ